MIVPHDQIVAEVRELHRTGGLPRGDLPGWPSVNELYSVALGQWTLITGVPGSGKSEFLDAIMVNLAKTGKWRFVIYSPENWPLQLHHSKIIEKYIGKPFNPGPNERVSEDELDEAEAWMAGKFHFAKPDRNDIVSILNEANAFASDNAKKCGIVIDPWNQLEHYRPAGITLTEYVSRALSDVMNWVRERNCHLWLVAHPSKMQKGKDGKLPVPTPHDVSDSMHFWNKCDAAIAVARDQSEYKNQAVDIHVQKVRFKHIGHVGLATLHYDRVTGRYAEPDSNVMDFRTRSK